VEMGADGKLPHSSTVSVRRRAGNKGGFPYSRLLGVYVHVVFPSGRRAKCVRLSRGFGGAHGGSCNAWRRVVVFENARRFHAKCLLLLRGKRHLFQSTMGIRVNFCTPFMYGAEGFCLKSTGCPPRMRKEGEQNRPDGIQKVYIFRAFSTAPRRRPSRRRRS
jgi:hypothetical protein